MGSGHILVYAFDVLMQIYESYGYTQRDAARSILKNNIFSNQYIEFFLEKVYGKMKFYYNYFKLRGDNNEKNQ